MRVHVHSLSTCLRKTKTVTKLDLFDLEFADSLDPTEAAQDLSTSIAHNDSMKELTCHGLQSVFLSAILTGFAEHTQIREVKLTNMHVYVDSFSTLLTNTKSITTLVVIWEGLREMFDPTFDPAETTAQNLATSIGLNNSIAVLECELASIYNTAILTGLCKHKQIREIKLSGTVDADLLSTFLRKITSLETLKLRNLETQDTLDYAATARNLSASFVKNDSIEVLICGDVDSSYQAAILTGLAGNTRIREFNLDLNEEYLLPGGGAMLLQALKQNSSLCHVHTDFLREEFSDAELALQSAYVKRNRHIHKS